MGKVFQDYLDESSTFKPRTTKPREGNRYYTKRTSSDSLTGEVHGMGGYSNCCLGHPLAWEGSTLCNCVGYAIGRFNEETGNRGANWVSFAGNACDFINSARAMGYPTGTTPRVGAIAVWSGHTYGHVAVVEAVYSKTEVDLSDSRYSEGEITEDRIFHYESHWNPEKGVYFSSGYKFLGYIYNPTNFSNEDNGDWDPASIGSGYSGYSAYGNTSHGGAYSKQEYTNYIEPKVETKTVTTEIVRNRLKSITDTNLNRTKSTNLLSYPSLVETPFIVVTVGDYTFGYFNRKNIKQSSGILSHITYPNFMESLSVTKVNGTVNQYTITMIYQIQAGDDPNLLDKIFSSVGYSKIKISYGDYSSPSFNQFYKEEEALITKIQSNVDFGNSRITYTISCTSSSMSIYATTLNFPYHKSYKPSDLIWQMLEQNVGGITDLFYGMKSEVLVRSLGLIASDDQAVEIQAKQDMDPLSYINYLVTCMIANSNSNAAILTDSSYYMTIHDDVYGENSLNGPYFKVSKVTSNTSTISSADVYEVDIGYPSDNMVTSFRLSDDNSWALLYKYSEQVDQQQNFVYRINSEGRIEQRYSPNISTNTSFITTPAQMSWWTKMTQFPVTATLEIKGLVRPAILMTYVRINALFYGQRHVSSGLYVITKQVDTVSKGGYKTTLTLLRVGGDQDYIVTEKSLVTTTYSVVSAGKVNVKPNSIIDESKTDPQVVGEGRATYAVNGNEVIAYDGAFIYDSNTTGGDYVHVEGKQQSNPGYSENPFGM